MPVKQNIARLLTAACALGFIALAGSSSNGAAAPPTQTLTPPMVIHPAQDRITPDTCLSPVVRPIHVHGGAIVLPGCAGYSGGITYSTNTAPNGQTVTIEDATSNFNGAPPPPGGAVLLYLTWKGSGTGSILFSMAPTNSTLKHTETADWNDAANGYAIYEFLLGSQQNVWPLANPVCNGGTPDVCTDTFRSPLTGANMPNGVTIDFELVKLP